MSDGRGTIREVVWRDLFPWLILFRTLRIAISLRILLLAAVALVTAAAGSWLIGQLFSGTSDAVVQTWITAEAQDWPRGAAGRAAARWFLTAAGQDALSEETSPDLRSMPPVGEWPLVGPVAGVWRRTAGPFAALFRPDLSVVGLAYALLQCLWTVAVWAVFAGAITRIAALALTREDALGPKSALVHALTKWRDYASAPLVPLLGVLLTLVFVGIPLGLLMRFDVFVLVAGSVWPIVLLAGLFLAIMAFGLLAGWPLLWPAVSVERSDAFDAISSCYAYVYQRPLHYLFYVLVAALIGALGTLVVSIFAFGVLGLSEWLVSWGSGMARLGFVLRPPDGDGYGWSLVAGASLIAFWTNCVLVVVPAFCHGFFWTAATAIYLLLRRDVDAKELDEIGRDDQDLAGGLPPLSGTGTGVPQMADPPADDT
jgi:hypothetical protein